MLKFRLFQGTYLTAERKMNVILTPTTKPVVRFIRGDADANGRLSLDDAIRILHVLFLNGDPLLCEKSGDVDDSGNLEIGDPIRILVYLFLGGVKPPAPFPGCGADATPDVLPCMGGGFCG